MITKTRIKNELNSFDEIINIEELLERLLFIEKLEERIEESKTQTGITDEVLKNDMEEWFK
jgi:hypothetical protein